MLCYGKGNQFSKIIQGQRKQGEKTRVKFKQINTALCLFKCFQIGEGSHDGENSHNDHILLMY